MNCFARRLASALSALLADYEALLATYSNTTAASSPGAEEDESATAARELLAEYRQSGSTPDGVASGRFPPGIARAVAAFDITGPGPNWKERAITAALAAIWTKAVPEGRALVPTHYAASVQRAVAVLRRSRSAPDRVEAKALQELALLLAGERGQGDCDAARIERALSYLDSHLLPGRTGPAWAAELSAILCGAGDTGVKGSPSTLLEAAAP